MIQHTAMWFRWHSLQFQARRWLAHNDADAIAARALFHLNRAARNGGTRTPYVYALKSRLIEHFYGTGHCVAVTRQKQHLPCWDCAGTGESLYTGGWCCRCDGTGIYRTHHLYRFAFDVHGRDYVWHQPQRLVRFNVELASDEQGEYKREPGNGVGLEREPAELYYVTLYEYLRQHDLTKDLNLTARPAPLVSCLRDDWRDTQRLWLRRQDWYWRWYWRAKRARDVWRAFRQFSRTGEWFLEDTIPF